MALDLPMHNGSGINMNMFLPDRLEWVINSYLIDLNGSGMNIILPDRLEWVWIDKASTGPSANWLCAHKQSTRTSLDCLK